MYIYNYVYIYIYAYICVYIYIYIYIYAARVHELPQNHCGDNSLKKTTHFFFAKPRLKSANCPRPPF